MFVNLCSALFLFVCLFVCFLSRLVVSRILEYRNDLPSKIVFNDPTAYFLPVITRSEYSLKTFSLNLHEAIDEHRLSISNLTCHDITTSP